MIYLNKFIYKSNTSEFYNNSKDTKIRIQVARLKTINNREILLKNYELLVFLSINIYIWLVESYLFSTFSSIENIARNFCLNLVEYTNWNRLSGISQITTFIDNNSSPVTIIIEYNVFFFCLQQAFSQLI